MEDFYRVSVQEQTTRFRLFVVEALKHWGVTGCEPELLKYRENAVYRVKAPDGRPAALRIHRHGYHSDAELRSELIWMQALKADGIDVPDVIPTQIRLYLRLSPSTKSQNRDRWICWSGLKVSPLAASRMG